MRDQGRYAGSTEYVIRIEMSEIKQSGYRPLITETCTGNVVWMGETLYPSQKTAQIAAEVSCDHFSEGPDEGQDNLAFFREHSLKNMESFRSSIDAESRRFTASQRELLNSVNYVCKMLQVFAGTTMVRLDLQNEVSHILKMISEIKGE